MDDLAVPNTWPLVAGYVAVCLALGTVLHLLVAPLLDATLAPPASAMIHIGLFTLLAAILLHLVLRRALRGARAAALQRQRDDLRFLDRLRVAQRMEMVGQLASGVAHDFNNILAVVQTSADVLATSAARDPADAELVEEIRRTVARGRSLVRRLLAVGRQESLRIADVQLAETASEALAMLRRLLPESVEVTLDSQPGLPLVRADPDAVIEILMNLATNARDAMPGGGRLGLALRRVSIGYEEERPRWLRPGNYVCLDVADTGSGMPPEVQERAFQPFFTTKSRGTGSGLGLAMVFGLMKQQRGYIDLHSESGRGTRVRLYFALSTEREPTAEHRALKDAPRGRGELILVVDDEAALVSVASRILENWGYNVACALNGEDAIEVYRDNDGAVDLVIADLGMPRLGGWGLYHALNPASGPGVPFLITSGYDPAQMAREIGTTELRERSVPFLPKPWSAEELLTAVRGALDRAAHL